MGEEKQGNKPNRHESTGSPSVTRSRHLQRKFPTNLMHNKSMRNTRGHSHWAASITCSRAAQVLA